MSYTIFINRREYTVPYKVYVAHCTQEFKTMQTNEVYNRFLNEYQLPKENVVSFMRAYLGNKVGFLINDFGDNNIIKIIEESRKSILYAAMVAEWISTQRTQKLLSGREFYKNRIVERYINYSRRDFSKEYNSLQPLTMFYHSLIFEINTGKDIGTKRKPNFIIKRDKISYSVVQQAIKDSGSSLLLEDIKEDLEKHAIILDMGDHYIWGSTMVQDWFFTIEHPSIYLINYNKITTL